MSVKQYVYPDLPSAPGVDHVMAGNNFRMSKVDNFQQYIRNEQLRYRKSYKTAKHACSVLKYSEYACHALDTMLKGTSVAFPLILPIAIPVSMAINAATICISIGKGFISNKRQKFLQILTLCTSKLDSITQHINKAINDGVISQEEFEIIHQEIINYDKLKNQMEEKFSQEMEKIQLSKELEEKIYEMGRSKGREEKAREVIAKL